MKKSSSFCYSLFIPFHLSDPAGIVFFANAFTLFHQAFEQFVIHRLHHSWDAWFQNPEWFVPLRHAESSYLHPLLAGKECLIEIRIDTASTSSFTLSSHIMQEEKLCCSLKTAHVFCSHTTKKKTTIPENIRVLLQAPS